MVKAIGVLGLALIGILPTTYAVRAGELSSAVSASHETVAIDIGRIKRALKLTPKQEVYWPPVEAALRALAHRQAAEESAGLVHRVSHKVVSVVFDAAAVRYLVVAARPLLASLSDDQKQAALTMAQEMGLGPVLAALD